MLLPGGVPLLRVGRQVGRHAARLLFITVLHSAVPTSRSLIASVRTQPDSPKQAPGCHERVDESAGTTAVRRWSPKPLRPASH